MDFKRLGRALLFPPLWLLVLLLPVSVVFLVYSMVVLGTESPISMISYVLSTYTLTVWCAKAPYLVRAFKTFKRENKYVVRWFEDEHLRMNVSLYSSLIFNTGYAVFQLWLGVYHGSFWFYSFAVYYISLALMRFFLLRYTRRHEAGERLGEELLRYRACGWLLLLMNLALTVIIFFMVYWNRTFHHHEITTIAMAAYTFTSFTVAIVGIVRYRKCNTPIYSAARAIGLVAASVSVLTLESTMLTTFGDGTMSPLSEKILLATSGGAISAFVLAIALYMIVTSTKQIKLKETENGQ
ncbi:MAG: hypothetical protein IJY65_02270 [Clostridia bacterium]|nr:hypothetical protein [Clostridia bacterium]